MALGSTASRRSETITGVMAAAITVPDSQKYETITAAPPEARAAMRRA
jgi:hypothetical protein